MERWHHTSFPLMRWLPTVGVFPFYSYSSYGCVHSSTFTHSLAVYYTGGKWYEFSLVAHYHSAP
ncbi:hypothetical protein FRC18_008506, partial [Serendipita sp. 400]